VVVRKLQLKLQKKLATGGPPPHFFKLVAKIKALGDDATPKYANQPRETVTRYKDFELTEQLDTGENNSSKI
jgi:hypothetical protein